MRMFEGFQKGVNLGGWISQYDEYSTEHFENFITEDDIRYIAESGFDHVRVPVDYNVLEDEDGTVKESGYMYLERCRKWCEKYGLNMLIDLHECFGYSFDPLKKDMDRKKFFYDSGLQERFLKLWRKIAEKFADHTDMVAFEPLNEVVLPEVADAWNAVLEKYIRMMREIAPKVWIVIGGVCYNNVRSVALIDVPKDDRIVYNFHCYDPMVFTHQGAYWLDDMPRDFRIGYPVTLDEYREKSVDLPEYLAGAVFSEDIRKSGPEFFEDLFKPAIEKAEKDNVPLYCGEYGVIELAADDDRKRWIDDITRAFEKYNIGRALWNYKEKDFGIKKTRTKDY